MLLHLTYDELTVVLVMIWHSQVTSHYFSHSLPNFYHYMASLGHNVLTHPLAPGMMDVVADVLSL